MKRPRAEDRTETPAVHRAAKLCLVLGLLGLGLWIEHEFIPALVWAAILGIATGPLYRRIRARFPRFGRGALLPSLFTLAFAVIIIAPISIGIVEAAREWRDAAQWIASARAHGVPAPVWLAHLPLGADQARAWWQTHLATPDATAGQIAHLNATAFARGRTLGMDLLHRAVTFAVTLIALFFVLKEQEALVAQLRVAGDKLLGPTGERVASQVALSVRGTINGLVFVGLGEGAVMTLLYWIAGVPHPLLLGALTAVAAMIPFGAALMFGIAALLLLGQSEVGWAIAIVVGGLIVVGIADHFVRPALIGGATRLPFLWALLSILGGVATLGLLGLFVGPGVMAALILLWREFVHPPTAEEAAAATG
jgi:predicted PurR-regulated permease PerM